MIKYSYGGNRMNDLDLDLTLLSEGQIWGNDNEPQLEVLKKYGTKAAVSDLCILTGCWYHDETAYNIEEDNSLKGRAGYFWTKSVGDDNTVRTVTERGYSWHFYKSSRPGAIRPVLQSSEIFSQVSSNRVMGYKGTWEVEYLEFPQYAVNSTMQNILELEYNKGEMLTTGGSYTFDSVPADCFAPEFDPISYEEYEYQGQKYIRMRVNYSNDKDKKFLLSNGCTYKDGDYVWIEVSPVKWLIDDKSKLLIAKTGLVSGIRFLDINHNYNGDFSKTEMKEYLDKHMAHDLTQSVFLYSHLRSGSRR